MSLLDVDQPFAHLVRDKSHSLPRHDDVEKLDFEAVEDTGSAASSVSDSSASTVSSDASSRKDSGLDRKSAQVAEAHTTYYPHPTAFKLSEQPIDEIRPLNVSRA